MGIKNYVIASVHSVGRIVYSAGQSYFANHGLSTYLFRKSTHPATFILPSIAVGAGFAVNLITRVPANFRTFAGINQAFSETVAELPELNKFGKCLHYFFQMSGHASNFFNALNAYFGTVVTIETLIGLFTELPYDELWQQVLIDLAALAIAISALAAFYAYEYQTISANGRRIAACISNWNTSWDRNMTKTLLLSTLNIMASPVLAKYWLGPSLSKVPFEEKFLKKLGKEIITWTAGVAAFTTGLTMLPSVYDFLNMRTTAPPAQNKSLARSLKISAYLAGSIDSTFAGACLSYAIICVSIDFKLAPYSYWQLLTIPFGISTTVLNMTFSVMPGYHATMNDLAKCKKEEDEPLLLKQELHELETPIVINLPDNQATFYRKKPLSLLFGDCCKKKREHTPEANEERGLAALPRLTF